MTSMDVSRPIEGSETSHSRLEEPHATYEQIARGLAPLRLVQRKERAAWAIDLLLAADLSVRDYDAGVDLVEELVYGSPERRQDLAARLLGLTS
jgi:hypothetical protein